MEVANASMYDGPSAAAEAVAMANRVTQRKRALISGGLHPHYRETIATLAAMTGFAAENLPPAWDAENLAAMIDDRTSCVVVQNPDVFGRLADHTKLAEACHAKGALLVVAVTEAFSLGLVMPPGAMGADIAVAEGQAIGNGLNFGGPYVGLFAGKEKYLRQMPGRLCGQTVDADGKRGFVLTLSAREQHIRREKATSNICTNSGLCALGFTIHLSLMGEAGFTGMARLNHAKACQLAEKLAQIPGCKILNNSFFIEFTVQLPRPAAPVVDALAKIPVLAGVPLGRFYPKEKSLANLLLVAATELTAEADMDALVSALRRACA
jgi:glycine dehydrogenase subunit 1